MNAIWQAVLALLAAVGLLALGWLLFGKLVTPAGGSGGPVYAVIPAPETYWAMTVASAAPATPRSSPTTNHRSRPMFSTADTARNSRGTTELPTERSREAK